MIVGCPVNKGQDTAYLLRKEKYFILYQKRLRISLTVHNCRNSCQEGEGAEKAFCSAHNRKFSTKSLF